MLAILRSGVDTGVANHLLLNLVIVCGNAWCSEGAAGRLRPVKYTALLLFRVGGVPPAHTPATQPSAYLLLSSQPL